MLCQSEMLHKVNQCVSTEVDTIPLTVGALGTRNLCGSLFYPYP